MIGRTPLEVTRRPGTGLPVLLAHGFLGDAGEWDRLLRDLPELNAYCLTVPGHGQTSCPADASISWFRAAFAETVAALGLAEFAVLGYSLGGRLALDWAVHDGQGLRCLIAESANPGIADPAVRAERLAADRTLADELVEFGLHVFLQKWYGQDLFASVVVQRADLVQRRATGNAQELSRALRAFSLGGQGDLQQDLGLLGCPVWWIAGALDPRYAEIAKSLEMAHAGVRAAIVGQAGHNVHLEQPQLFARLLVRILRDPCA